LRELVEGVLERLKAKYPMEVVEEARRILLEGDPSMAARRLKEIGISLSDVIEALRDTCRDELERINFWI